MKEKLTLQDLVDLLAKKTSLTKKEADAFFRELFAVIIDDVFNEEPVKIKDFGTFKLTKVSSRESVNVNTGEKIEIPAHYKLSFLPDKSLKSLVNKPFAQFETTLMEDGVSFDSIEESEEPAESPEEEDTATDEVEVVQQVKEEQPTAVKEEVVAKEKGKSEDENVTEIIELPIASPYSSVYNVSVTGESSSDAVTFVLPKDNITYEQVEPKAVVVEKPENETKEEVISEQDDVKAVEITDEIIEQPVVAEEPEADKVVMDLDIEGLDVSLGGTIPFEPEKIQEKIDQLQKAIEVLSKAKIHSEQLKAEAEAKAKIEEQRQQAQKELEEAEAARLKAEAEAKAKVVSEEVTPDPVVYEDVTEEIRKDAEAKDIEILNKLEPVDGSEPSIVFDKEKAADTPEDYDEDYYSYYQESNWVRIRRRLPIILFLLIIIGFGAFYFKELFNNEKSVYIPGDKALTESDTLPYIHEGITPFANDTNVSDLSSMLIDSDSLSKSTVPEITPSSVDSAKYKFGNYGYEDNRTEEGYDKVISDYLRIKVVNKAQKRLAEVDSLRVPVSNKPTVVETVKAGSSLRSIATKHYGNYIYWVYIYEENRDKLKDIDNLAIGVVLTIPDLEKYGVQNRKEQSAIDKAKQLDQKLIGSRGN